MVIMFPCISNRFPIATRRRPSCCARATARAAGSRSVPCSIFPTGRRTASPASRCCSKAAPSFLVTNKRSPSSARCRMGTSPRLSARRARSALTACSGRTATAVAILSWLQACRRPHAVAGHGQLQPRPAARPRSGRRGRTLHHPRLARRPPAGDRDGARQRPPRRRHPGALRRLVELHGRPLLPAGPVRLQP